MELLSNIHWIIAASIAPIPLFHLWLHALLPWWKKHAWLFYLCGLLAWAASFWYFSFFGPRSEYMFEFNPMWRVTVGYVLMGIGAIGILASIFTLGPKRFFVWAVLRPNSAPKIRIIIGPFLLIPHPAYMGEILIAIGNFLVRGQFYLLSLAIFLIVLMPIIIVLEEEELRRRLSSEPRNTT